ncbi:hypothetical protein ANO11243_085700 [Dothideomycetidae sp. 11243]|nr:hypothetical protein ANO11243_085700 [fungal sp. No.11243]
MPYRFEVAKTGRAGCKDSECKKTAVKILKGEFRVGTYFKIPGQDHDSWSWKHWGCVTPKQLENIKSETGEDQEMIDGYEELPEDYQEKILRAMAQGHVDDDDWRHVGRPHYFGIRMLMTMGRRRPRAM